MAASSCRIPRLSVGQSKSPTAHGRDGTDEQFGGTARVVITTVYIGQHGNNRVPGNSRALEWFGLSSGRDTVQMNWVSPAHLEVVYQKATVNSACGAVTHCT